MLCFVGPKSPAATSTTAAAAGGEENGDGRQFTRDAGNPASAEASTTASSVAASPVAATISLNREYALAVETNSYNEIWSKIHHHRPSEEEPWTSPNAHLVIDRVLQPDRQSIHEVLRSARPSKLTRLVSDYLDSSEHTSHLFLSLRNSVERGRALYAPISQLLDLIPSPPPSPHMSSAQCDWAYDKFQEFNSLDNPFGGTTSCNFVSMRICFAQLQQQLDHRLLKTRRRHRLLRRATHGSAACLIGSTAGAAIAGLVIATHALGALVAGPFLSCCLPTKDLMSDGRRRLREHMARLDAAARGTYVLDNHLDTIECLVARLHATIESDKVLVQLGLEGGRGKRHPIEEVLRQLRKNHPSLLLQLRDLDEHVCLCLAAVNRARTHHIHQSRRMRSSKKGREKTKYIAQLSCPPKLVQPEYRQHNPPDYRQQNPPEKRSWAAIAGASTNRSEQSPLIPGETLNKLRASIKDFCKIDFDFHLRAKDRFQFALYGKFLGKALPLDTLKGALNAAWKEMGEFHVADLPNGYYLINCSSEEMYHSLLFEGPWTVSGLVLQLFPWRENFQPAFEHLATAAIWIQLHHLPIEFWEGETFEMIASHFGRLLRIDKHTSSLSRAKFARVCVEIDLSQPLKRGLWIGNEEHKVFIVAIYEKLPVFCYSCGLVGHGTVSCKSKPESSLKVTPGRTDVEPGVQGSDLMGDAQVNMLVDRLAGEPVPVPEATIEEPGQTHDEAYGPWMVVTRRRGRGRGRGPANSPRPARQNRNDDTWPQLSSQDRHVAKPQPVRVSSPLSAQQETDCPLRADPTVDPDPLPLVIHQPPGEAFPSNGRIPNLGSKPSYGQNANLGSKLANPTVGGGSSLDGRSTTDSGATSDLKLLDKGKAVVGRDPHSPHRNEAPPLLLSSIGQCQVYDDTSHAMIVDKVQGALDMECAASEEGSLDSQMAEEQDGASLEDLEPDDAMTLDSFQIELKQQARTRRSLGPAASKAKKGRTCRESPQVAD